MIKKLATVMGIRVDPDDIYDPDPTYVLTVDNLFKMLAIQMRFRYCIIIPTRSSLYVYKYHCMIIIQV